MMTDAALQVYVAPYGRAVAEILEAAAALRRHARRVDTDALADQYLAAADTLYTLADNAR